MQDYWETNSRAKFKAITNKRNVTKHKKHIAQEIENNIKKYQ